MLRWCIVTLLTSGAHVGDGFGKTMGAGQRLENSGGAFGEQTAAQVSRVPRLFPHHHLLKFVCVCSLLESKQQPRYLVFLVSFLITIC
jgi:hypothetical protein